MDKSIKVGLFGVFRGKAFVHMLNRMDGVCLHAIVEKDPTKIADIRDRLLPETLICNSFEEMLDTGIDAVILANYFHEHAKVAIAAMEHGCDVISETTAAATLGECLDLVEAAERTGKRYMLAANCPGMPGPFEMQRLYKEGTLGEVCFAEADYDDATQNLPVYEDKYCPDPMHWRNFCPMTYYNMHTLGTLMEITGLEPRRVNGVTAFNRTSAEGNPGNHCLDIAGFGMYEMENGAIFRTSGCSSYGPTGKWYRVTCLHGSIETARTDEMRVLYCPNGEGKEGNGKELVQVYDMPKAEDKLGIGISHKGKDYRMMEQIYYFLIGKYEPFFDVYRSVILSAAGILAFYSALDEGRAYVIPDFRDKKAREVCRGDYRTPFPDKDGKVSMPCTIHHLD